MPQKPHAPPPVRLLKRKLAVSNSKWRVYFDDIAQEGHDDVMDYLVLASQTPTADGITGVSILPVRGEQVVLLHLWRHGIDALSWEIPRGFVDAGEDPRSAALRELREETGLECPDEALIPLGHIAPESGTIAGTIALFAALQCQPAAVLSDDDEIGLLEAREFPLAELILMARKSQILDVSTLVALYRYLDWRVQHGDQTAPKSL